MAELSGLDMVREIIGQINNLRKLVTIGGKQYKWDAANKKYKSVKDGKVFTRPQLIDYVKNQKFTAPKVPKEKPKTKLKVKTTPKPKQNPLQIGKEKLNTFTQNRMNERWLNNSKTQNKTNKLRVGSDGMTRGSRATVNNMMPGRQGGGIATMIAGPLLGEGGLDPGGHLGNWIGNRILPGPDRTLQENNALRAQLLAEKEINKQNKQLMIKATQEIKDPQQTGGVIGRRNEQYIDRPQPTPTPKKKKPSTNYVKTPSPTWKGEDKPKNKLKSKKKESKKSGKSKEQIAWEKKSKNSPARKSGAFTDKELWNQYKKHQEWLKKNNRLKVRS